MKKKLLVMLLLTTISLSSLASCGSNTDNTQESVTETQESTEHTEATETFGTEATEAVDSTAAEDTQEVTEDTQAVTETTESQEENQDTQEQSASADQEVQTSDDSKKEETKKEETDKTEETQKEKYTYTELSETRYAKSSVNVRDLPSTDGKQLGKLSQYDKVTVTGKCNETGWYRISYKNGTGYVSSKYLITESEKAAAEQKAKEEAEKAAKEEAEKKAQESAKKEESSKKEETTKTEESNKKTEQTTDTKKEESSKKEETQKQESQKKEPEWIMWESASNKYLTDAQKKHIDGMVKKWLNDDSYTDSQLHTDLADYLMSIGINVGFGNPEPCVSSFGIYKYDDMTLSKKKQGRLENYEKIVREEATVYDFRAFYTKWEYYDDGSLIVYDCSVGIL